MGKIITMNILRVNHKCAQVSQLTVKIMCTDRQRNGETLKQNQNQNRFIRPYYRPRRPPLRPIWSLSQNQTVLIQDQP